MRAGSSRQTNSIVLWKTGPVFLITVLLVAVFLMAALPLPAREKDATQYGMGLVVNMPFPESAVVQVVQDVVQNGVIRGTKEYNKDEYISDAVAATSTRVFAEWTEGGRVFYKVRVKALDPRNFKNSGDLGTLAVRYVVQAQDDKNTVLRIDARFVEDFRHTSHPSNGSVESAEYKDIHDRLDAMELSNAQALEAQKERQEPTAKKQTLTLTDETHSSAAQIPPANSATAAPTDSSAPPQTLEQRLQTLRQQVERRVKAPGAPLKSAPFHTATTLKSLPAGTEVLIVVSTTYWLGVETHEGQHGWMLRDELEFVP